ncbi:MAG TPA: 6-bladed beta-propeller [Candidatus Saccharimonadales bacterium]|nr:6-bladed beta-propeller [Candidatus Saccharimonadales bacterium]
MVGIGASLAATCLGAMVALWATGLARRGQQLVLLAAAVVLALPPFLSTNCWLHYLGNAGVWRGFLPWNIYSLTGAVWIMALMFWPISFFAGWGAWRTLQPSQLENDLALGGLALVRYLLWPMAKPALGLSFGLVFVLALNNFAVPSILQVKVYSAEIWLRFSTTFDYAAVLALSIPLVVAPMVVLVTWRGGVTAWPRGEGQCGGRFFRQQLGSGSFAFCGMVSLLVLLFSLGMPAFELLGSSRTWTELPTVFMAEPRVVYDSFLFAASAALLCLAIGFMGWRKKWGFVLWIPFLIPGVLIGMALIFVLNRPVVDAIYHSVALVVLSWVIRYAGISWNGLARVLRGVDAELVEIARMNGAKGWQLFKLAYLPQIIAPAAGLGYVTYLLCLWDVESIVLTCPPGGETLSLHIFSLLHYGHTTQVNALCLLLLILAAAPLGVWAGWGSFRQNRFWPLALPCLFVAGLLSGCSPTDPLKSRFFGGVQVIGGRGTRLGEFNKPRSVAVDRKDNLYAVDMTGRVQKFTPAGAFVLSWQMPQTDLGKPKGMDCDSAGNILVLEPHYQRVNQYSPEGKLLAQWGKKGGSDGELTLPRSIAVNLSGDILVSEYTTVDRVQCFSAGGRSWKFSFGHPGNEPGAFNRAEGLGLDSSNRIYVADSCNHRIQIFSPEGKFIRMYGRPGSGRGELSYPYDIRIDPQGFQYVCEFGNSRIQIFDAQDRPVEIIGGVGAGSGKMNNPWSLALDSKGNLYVADANNHRVQKFIRKKTEAGMESSVQMARQ